MLERLDNNNRGSDPVEGQLVPYGVRSIETPKPRPKPSQWVLKLLGVAVTLLVLSAAVLALRHMLREVSVASVMAALDGISIGPILLSVLLVALSYLTLTGYDLIGLTYLRRRLPYSKVALGSFLSYAFANNLGFALLTGGSVRYRIYSSERVTAGDVAILTVLCGLTFALSAVLMVGLCLLVEPVAMAATLKIPQGIATVLGTLILLGLIAYVVWVGLAKRTVAWSSVRFALPGARSTLAQLAVGAADMCLASGALYVLLPGDPGVGYFVFVSVFAAAIALGLLSHVPGGLGVFETVMLLALPGLTTDQILASLLVYRCVYYLLPLMVAIGLLVWYEARHIPLLNPGSRRVAALVRLGRRSIRPFRQATIGFVRNLVQIVLRARRPT